MSVQASVRPPHAGLLGWLASHDVPYELHEHPVAFTARETARLEHIDPRTFAKTLAIMADDGRKALLVVDGADMLDLVKARRALEARHVRLLTEEELDELAPSCDLGTIPPVPELFTLPVFADYAVRDDPRITFHAGSHGYCVRVDRLAWERAAGITYADLAEERDARPRWALS